MTPPAAGAAARAEPLDHKEIVAAARTLILVGNPNVGKSVLFGALTGKYVTVSNYPGTTVEVTRGSADDRRGALARARHPGHQQPAPHVRGRAGHPRHPARASRTTSACRSATPRTCAAACSSPRSSPRPGSRSRSRSTWPTRRRRAGFRIDEERLAAALGVDVVPTVAIQRTGLPAPPRADPRGAAPRGSGPATTSAIEAALAEVEPLMPEGGSPRRSLGAHGAGRRRVAAALAGRAALRGRPGRASTRSGARLAARYPESLRFVVARQRLAAVDRLHDAVVTRGERSAGSALARRLGAWSTHPVYGDPRPGCWCSSSPTSSSGVFGAKTAVDFLENTVFYDRVVPWTEALLRWIVPAGPVQEFLVGPPGRALPRARNGFLVGKYGLVSMGLSYGMAIVLPIVTTFFLAFSVLEDSGYLPRLAVMVNQIFKCMGLNGKAVLPMVLGLGCDTMATMTARIMETRKERVIVTLLLALGGPLQRPARRHPRHARRRSPSRPPLWFGGRHPPRALPGGLAGRQGDPRARLGLHAGAAAAAPAAGRQRGWSRRWPASSGTCARRCRSSCSGR